jgi:predicted RNA binding protein YcfA (HicA-like mRNA interferase family)
MILRGMILLKSYSSREIVRLLTNDGWVLVRIEGSHHMFRHDTKPGTVTVPHPKKDLPVKTSLSILKQAGIKHS